MWPNLNNRFSKPNEAVAQLRSEAAHIWEARGQAITNGNYDVGSGKADVVPVAQSTPESTNAA